MTNIKVYWATPRVFRLDSDEQERVNTWASIYEMDVFYPGRKPVPSTQEDIYARCRNDALDADVGIFDLDSFRGNWPDIGVCVELGMMAAANKLLIGHADRKPTHAQIYETKKDPKTGLLLIGDGTFLDAAMWNTMVEYAVRDSRGEFFFGDRDARLAQAGDFIRRAFQSNGRT